MIPPETSDEMCPSIQRQRARRERTTDRTREKDQNLRGESHGGRHKTKQKAVEVTHAHINGYETLVRIILAEVPKGTLVKKHH